MKMPMNDLPDPPQGCQRPSESPIGQPWMVMPRLAGRRLVVTTIVPIALPLGDIPIWGELARPARMQWRYQSWPSVSREADALALMHRKAIRRVLLAALPDAFGDLIDLIDAAVDETLAAELRVEMQLIEDARRG
jgi:hypothetical protein